MILDLLQRHKVVCIVGEAGCGKSTMVPQFILDQSLASDSCSFKTCHILVSQPRRVGAMKLAQMVAQMRGESCGQTVGFCIGGEKCVSPKSQIVYCTCGYLLQVRMCLCCLFT